MNDLKEDNANNRICKRGEDLLDIIKLNKLGFSNCDIPPINYDIFIRSFGVRFAKQVDCQTVLRKHIGVQTDLVNISNKWTQTPPVMNLEFGSDVIEQNKHKFQIQNTDPFILNNFLLKTQILMSIVIKSEYNGEDNNNKISAPSGAEKFSKSYSTIKCLEICKKSPINYMFANGLHLFCVQNVAIAGSAEKSLIAIWNLVILGTEPEKLLICRSHITCAISDNNSMLVIAGLIDGSVVLWDTREQPHYHKKIIVGQNKAFILRTPSYNSAVTGKGHNCEIISIDRISSDNLDNDLFQFSTIDRNGFLIIWTITEAKNDSNDSGISPVSKWTLIRNSIVNVIADFSEYSNTKITSFQCPYDWSNFYCGTDSGVVIRCARHEQFTNILPKIFSRSGILGSNHVIVTSMKFDELSTNVFLVGYSDGIICYFTIDKEESLFVFDTNDFSINVVQWFSNKSQTFIAFNDNNEVFIFDLNNNSTKFGIYYKHANKENRLSSFTLCKGFYSFLIFGTSSGNCDVFTLNDKFSLF